MSLDAKQDILDAMNIDNKVTIIQEDVTLFEDLNIGSYFVVREHFKDWLYIKTEYFYDKSTQKNFNAIRLIDGTFWPIQESRQVREVSVHIKYKEI